MDFWVDGKSPKAWLNQICMREIRSPRWETEEANPGEFPPVFKCRCTLEYNNRIFETQGTGRTKKEAEQKASLDMLTNKLQMTSDMLRSLTTSKKKPANGSSSVDRSDSPRPISSSAPAPPNGSDDDAVSDTDDAETNEIGDPVSELAKVCGRYKLEAPTYEVDATGPPHKKIFTARTTVKELGLSLSARRRTKRFAKKILAFRMLREVQSRLYKDVLNEKDERSSKSVPTEVGEVTLDKEVGSGMERLTLKSQRDHKISVAGPTLKNGDNFELNYCYDYYKIFQLLKKSNTLKKIMYAQLKEPYSELGGSTKALEKIAGEIRIKTTIFAETMVCYPGTVALLELTLPYDFNNTILPNKAAVQGYGVTLEDAMSKAADNAIAWMKDKFNAVSA